MKAPHPKNLAMLIALLFAVAGFVLATRDPQIKELEGYIFLVVLVCLLVMIASSKDKE